MMTQETNTRSTQLDLLEIYLFLKTDGVKPIKLLLKQLVFILLIIINEICGKLNCTIYFFPEVSSGCGKLPNSCS